ncbi:MAG: Nuclear import receptor [Chrysothrix sp. TS-e1954]|nr:MAG: Nuclear import receptor [Chrysothrix sp. TS-e1954]
MASNGDAKHAFAPVLKALETLQSNVDKSRKTQAHEFLNQFQKSPEAWTSTISLLQSQDAAPEARLFAATTLKGKITYDLNQLPRNTLPQLRSSLLSLLSSVAAGPKPIRTQLCVCLAILAVQMTEWKNVLQSVVDTLGKDPQSITCMLEFVHVLPEEVTEGRKINLAEDELATRTQELLEDQAPEVLQLLIQYSQSSGRSLEYVLVIHTDFPALGLAAVDPQLLDCITTWLRELPLSGIVESPLLDTVMNALSSDKSFDAAVECLCSIVRETRDVDECMSTIQTLYPRIISLKPRIAAAIDKEDNEAFKGITKIFAETGESWVVLIARLPAQFRDLVEAVLECAARDTEHEAVGLTFIFWYELKQYLELQTYEAARTQYADIYSRLVDVMIRHLEYPRPEDGDETDLFDGDREQEEKFREYRHQMGDVLKDCCEVIGVSECLKKSYDNIQAWISQNASSARDGQIPNWQSLEAPLFSMRAMGRQVSPNEEIMLPSLIPLITQIPDHDKVRFQAVMALGRYTEWTAKHPDTLQAQLNYIMGAFEHSSLEVKNAAALAFRFFCTDCAGLLKGYVDHLHQFYDSQLDKLNLTSQSEITEGVAAVIAQLPINQIYPAFKMYCDPVLNRFKTMAQSASNEKLKFALADRLELLVPFLQWIQPFVEPSQPHPAVQYCQEMFPVLSQIANAFSSFPALLEKVCRCWRQMVLSYRTAMTPLLPQLAESLASGFNQSKQGCFLWATDSIIREFSEGTENVDSATSDAIFSFYEQQATASLRTFSDVAPEELPDVIDDFFRLETSILLYYPQKRLLSPLSPPIIQAATAALTLLKEDTLLQILHFLRDLLAYGSETWPYPIWDSTTSSQTPRPTPPDIRSNVVSLWMSNGEVIVQRVLTGMMYSFPRDCIPDASGVLLGMFEMLPEATTGWVAGTVAALPEGSVIQRERERLVGGIQERVVKGEFRKVRAMLQDFTTGYRRRNVNVREGLGRLEATRFKFEG